MKTTIDFSRSFLTFRIDSTKRTPATVSHQPPFRLNNARIQIECRCRVVERQSGAAQEFVLGASCKTERVGVERDLWTQPNADFAPIFSEQGFMNLKTYARVGVEVELYPPGSGRQSDRQSGRTAETFDGVRIDLRQCPAEPLTGPEPIVQATLANQPLVARTRLESPRYIALIEYPVKTMNANERDLVYQIDTGPVLMPDLTCPPESLVERFELAFVAWNDLDWAEFLVRVPTPVTDEVSVYHYSRPLRLQAKNEIWRCCVGDA